MAHGSDLNGNAESIIQRQRQFFLTGATRSLSFRKDQLRRLYENVRKYESRILAALNADMHKPAFEAYSGEVGFVLEEIRFAIKNVDRWAKVTRVPTPLLHFRAHSEIHYDPYGTVLVIAPWNYPFQLLIAPVVGAIAAGNTVVVKPSEIASATERVVVELIGETFDDKFVAAYPGGVEATKELLSHQFDYIFFTGGSAIGKIVMAAATKYLTPLTLELGGKSPAIVDKDADLDVTARRLVWGKFYNAGQTCVAPDYLLVHKSIRDLLVEKIGREIEKSYGPEPMSSPDYASIIDQRHFDRLTALIPTGKVLRGGQFDRASRRIAPTLMECQGMSEAVMADELFGPILPIIAFESLDGAIAMVRERPNPLALYFFSNDKSRQDRVIGELAFGGGCINDTLIHLGNPHLPFGGVGMSGMGGYHGKFSFEAFSHRKGIIRKAFRPDFPVRYAPYNRLKLRLIRLLMK